MSSSNGNNRKNRFQNLQWFARPPKFAKRMGMMICGVIAQGLGLSLLRSIALGTDPCSCLTQGVTNFVPLSFGTCQLMCHLVTFLFVIRFDLSMIGFGTIGNMCFLGYISDFLAGFGRWCCRLAFLKGQLQDMRCLFLRLLYFYWGLRHICVLDWAPHLMMHYRLLLRIM